MTVSKAQKLAVKKYREKTYDTIGFDVPKGKREEFKDKAAKLGLSLAKFLFVAAETYGEGIAADSFTKPEKPELSADERRLLDEFNQLPSDTRKALVKLVKSINQAGVVVKPGDQTTPK